MPNDQQELLKILAALPAASFPSLEENPTTRLDLELSILHGDRTALAALVYSAWLAEERAQKVDDEHWQRLAQLADRAGERESMESFWPHRLVRPWAFSSVPLDTRVFTAMKEQGRSTLEVVQALRDAGAGEVDAVHILRSLFGMELRDALTLFRAP